MPLAPSRPPSATRITVAGRTSERNARLSPKASAKTTGAAQASLALTNSTMECVISARVIRSCPSLVGNGATRAASPQALGKFRAGAQGQIFREHSLRLPGALWRIGRGGRAVASGGRTRSSTWRRTCGGCGARSAPSPRACRATDREGAARQSRRESPARS